MYFKMDHLFVECEEFKNKVQIGWDQSKHKWRNLDARIRWDKAWKSVGREGRV